MNPQIEYYNQKLFYEVDSADLFDALNAKGNIVVIDARKTPAFTKEHIPLAISFPHREMNEQTTSHFDKNALYITYCDGIGCNASTKAALKLASLGFQVKELLGGLDWWKRDGYATEGEKAQDGTIIQCTC
jgi:rhodanese-related sulfurtransferase